MFVKVSDIYGAVTTQETTVVVKPKPLDASDVNQLAGAVDSDFESGDLAKGAGLLQLYFCTLFRIIIVIRAGISFFVRQDSI